jgi:uncharacterized protein (DUF2267 family)
MTWQPPPILNREKMEHIVAVAMEHHGRQYSFRPGTAERAVAAAMQQGSKEAVFSAIKEELQAGMIERD